MVLSGPIHSGKTTLSAGLTDRLGSVVFKSREALARRISKDFSDRRKPLQAEGARLDRATNGRWVVQELLKWLRDNEPCNVVVVDAVRIAGQVEGIRDAFGARVVHIHLTAPEEVLRRRHEEPRERSTDSGLTFEQARNDETERNVESLASIADAVIDTNRCTQLDVLSRAISHIRVHNRSGYGYVDVIVGGQYGSEGKGQVASFIAKEYDLLVRVGGPNAGHKVFSNPPYTHHQLPSGTRFNTEARLLIGSGAVLNVPKLLKEIADCDVDAKRLVVDRNAMIILPKDIRREEGLRRGIGSTKSGTGAATSRRIMERNIDTKLARHIPSLRPYLGDAFRVLEDSYLSGQRILLEGTQGTGLSLYHGAYPYVTSRDTSAGGCLAEAGIPPGWVRRVLMVCRTYPIRVESPSRGTSGPLNEIGWAEVARRSGLDVRLLRKRERTSTTDRRRRVGEFDWSLLRKAALLNGATDIALTFVDYLDSVNAKAFRFEQLTPDSIRFIDEVERVAGIPVSMVTVGFNNRSVIDRRAW